MESSGVTPHTFEESQAVLLICVKYGADDEAERYLRSLRLSQSHINLHVLVVENTVGTDWLSRAKIFGCQGVQSHCNLGYLGGARYGLSQYLKDNPLPQWIIVSNVDLTIPDLDFIDRLTHLRLESDVAVVAPSIRSNLTGIDQNPYMRSRPSSRRMHLYKWLYKSRLTLNAHELSSAAIHRLGSAVRTSCVSTEQNVSPQAIYAAHGSFLIFNRIYFERGGNLDYPQFLYGEEIYLAEQVRSLNLKIMYEPSLVVVHEEHRSTQLFKSPEIARYVASSAAYCADNLFPLHSKS